MNEVELRRERRAKMLHLQRSMDPSGADPNVRTSAPSVRQVDQFTEQFGTADKRKQTPPAFVKDPPKSHVHGQLNRQGPNKLSQRSVSATFHESNDISEEDLEAEISSVFGQDKQYASLASSIGSTREHGTRISGSGDRGNNNDGFMMRGNHAPKYSGAFYDSGFGAEKKGSQISDVGEARDELGTATQMGGNKTFGPAMRKSQSFDLRGETHLRRNRPSSHTTKIYNEEGQVVEVDDPGYASSPGSNHLQGDLLSQSLKDWKSKSNTDLTASLRSNVSVGSRGNARCVYDSRIFNMRKPSKVGTLDVKKTSNPDPEADYFAQMKNMHDTKANNPPQRPTTKDEPASHKSSKADTLKEFLNQSFSRTFSRGSTGNSSSKLADSTATKTSPHGFCKPMSSSQGVEIPMQNQGHHKTLAGSNGSHLGNAMVPFSGPNNHLHTQFEPRRSHQRPFSPTDSVLTASEFGDPDKRGRARGRSTAHKARDKLSASFNGLLIMIPGIGGMFGPSANMDGNMERGPEGRWSTPGESLPVYDPYDKPEARQQKLPCWTLFLLLAIDIFTIILAVILFSQIYDNNRLCCQPEADRSRGNPLPLEGSNFLPTTTNLHNGSFPFDNEVNLDSNGIQTRSFVPNEAIDNGLEDTFKAASLTPSSESTPASTTEGAADPDMTNIVQSLSNQIRSLQDELEVLRKPPAFACYKTEPQYSEGVVKYNNCNIPTQGMDRTTGVFTVKKAGVYRLSFSGLFNAINGHRVTADIMRMRSSKVLDFLGRSAAETNEAGALFGGVDDDIMVTGTVTVLEYLQPDDTVFVRIEIENNHKESRIHSTNNKAIHFTGQRISD